MLRQRMCEGRLHIAYLRKFAPSTIDIAHSRTRVPMKLSLASPSLQLIQDYRMSFPTSFWPRVPPHPRRHSLLISEDREGVARAFSRRRHQLRPPPPYDLTFFQTSRLLLSYR